MHERVEMPIISGLNGVRIVPTPVASKGVAMPARSEETVKLISEAAA
jgi:hypothetical protein